MNERIQELMEQATVQVDPDDREWVFFKVDQAKFAELIIRECIVDFYRNCLDITSNEDIVVQVERYVQEHFGVK